MAEKRRPHRFINERIVVRGTLVIQSPAHFGSGEADALTDMPVLLNEVDDRPLLPGTSIAGALRNYLREIELGDGVAFPDKLKPAYERQHHQERGLYSTLLFGGYRGDDDGLQSPLVVNDSVGLLSSFELRDGVAIDASSRTAADDQKFDIQLLAAGTSFPLQFELSIGKDADREKLLAALATSLKGLEEGAITLGARKRRGFGKCTVANWEVERYDLETREGMLAWLASERRVGWERWAGTIQKEKSIEKALGVVKLNQDARERLTLKATFMLDGTLLIRSGFGESDARADTVHLHAYRPSKEKGKDPEPVPVIPGTSWAGVLRHRALKIARTMADRDQEAIEFVDGMFGPSDLTQDPYHARASRVEIEESEVRKVSKLEITRVKIDRFTGGAFESALFTEQPLVGTPESAVDLTLTLRSAPELTIKRKQAEVGLLLLLLKDLWTGDLPIGGESGVGRGRLKGVSAELKFGQERWQISREKDGRLSIIESANSLEDFVKAFNQEVSNG